MVLIIRNRDGDRDPLHVYHGDAKVLAKRQTQREARIGATLHLGYDFPSLSFHFARSTGDDHLAETNGFLDLAHFGSRRCRCPGIAQLVRAV